MTTLRVRVELRDLETSIWRELLLPSDLPLERVHEVLQAAMGWHDAHLHSFARGEGEHGAVERRWVRGDPKTGFPDGDDPREVAETGVPLSELMSRQGEGATYVYDFGDDWEHHLCVIEVMDDDREASDAQDRQAGGDHGEPVLVAGAGACPPEDCGGVPGYVALLAAVEESRDGTALDAWAREQVLWAFGSLEHDVIDRVLVFDLDVAVERTRAASRPLPPLCLGLEEIVTRLPGVGPASLRGCLGALDLDGAVEVGDDAALALTAHLR